MIKIFLVTLAGLFATSAFCQVIINKDSTLNVGPATTAVKNLPATIAKPFLKIYPNPAKNKVSLQVSGFDIGIATVKIMDTKGKTVRVDNRLLANGTDEINMFLQLDPGIYFISINEKAKVIKKKLVVL